MFNKNCYQKILTPCHIIDANTLINNLQILYKIKKEAGCKLLFANKGFTNDYFYKYFDGIVDGISASGLFEAKLAKEKFKGEVHTFSPSYTIDNYRKIDFYSDVTVFNSKQQFNLISEFFDKTNSDFAIRINPEYSEQKDYRIDPCHRFSRFGVHMEDLTDEVVKNIKGLHLHSMCEQYEHTLKNTMQKTISTFDEVLKNVQWLNLGGGQLYTDEKYNILVAINIIKEIRERYKLDIYIEPCEAFLLKAGFFASKVVDVVYNGINNIILDSSVICHLPDIVHSPFRCNIIDSGHPFEKAYTYRICGCSCYAGDIFGDYSFDKEIYVGDILFFEDTAHYSMVKNNMFNGIQPPHLFEYNLNENLELIKSYGFDVFYSMV